MINNETSHDAWEVLEALYGRHTWDMVQQMRGELQSLTKSSSSLEPYLHKVKSLALSLHGTGKSMDDDDFIICSLRGLGSALNAKDNCPPLENVICKLRDFEIRLSPSTQENFSVVTLYTNRAVTSKSKGNYSTCACGSSYSPWYKDNHGASWSRDRSSACRTPHLQLNVAMDVVAVVLVAAFALHAFSVEVPITKQMPIVHLMKKQISIKNFWQCMVVTQLMNHNSLTLKPTIIRLQPPQIYKYSNLQMCRLNHDQ